MFNIGFSELLILAVIGLIVLGPEQLPDIARKLAKMLNELKRAKDEMMSPVDEMTREARQALDRARRTAQSQVEDIVAGDKTNQGHDENLSRDQLVEKAKREDG